MHEYSITCSIIDILNKLVKKHNIKKIKKINFKLSPVAHIEPQSIEFYYDFMAKDNKIIKNAALNFQKNEIRLRCSACGKTFESKTFTSKCIYCSCREARIIEEDDIVITSIEI